MRHGERFWSKVSISDVESCWFWLSADDGHGGYGRFWLEGRAHPAHRVAYELARGPIPAGLEIDHLCRNRRCVNPSHLEPVTRLENRRRAVPFIKRPTKCPAGHPYDKENSYVTSTGRKNCRQCHREANLRYYYRKAARLAGDSS